MVEVLVHDNVGHLKNAHLTWVRRIGVCAAKCLRSQLSHGTSESTVTVVLVDNDEIAELHQTFFDDPTTTDVITFPSGEPWFDDEQHLGDIVICLDVAREQAANARHSPAREVAYLVIHGLLHLAGYEDRTDRERESMLLKQQQLLEECEHACGSEPS